MHYTASLVGMRQPGACVTITPSLRASWWNQAHTPSIRGILVTTHLIFPQGRGEALAAGSSLLLQLLPRSFTPESSRSPAQTW